jgi:hypothetical protein
LQQFDRQLGRIASEFDEFARLPDDWLRDSSAVAREAAKQSAYFDEHFAGLVLNADRALLDAWGAALLRSRDTSGLAGALAQMEAARLVRRRFPIVLRRHTPQSLREVMGRVEFEQRTFALIEEMFGIDNRKPAQTNVPEISPSPPTTRTELIRARRISALLSLPEVKWNTTHAHRALAILRSFEISLRAIARAVAEDGKADSDKEETLYLRVRRLSQKTRKRRSKTLTAKQAQLVPTLCRLLDQQVTADRAVPNEPGRTTREPGMNQSEPQGGVS